MPQVSLDHKEVPAASVDLWESFDRYVQDIILTFYRS